MGEQIAKWHLASGRKTFGPYTAEQLAKSIEGGQANASTKICRVGTQEWRPLRDELPDLFPAQEAPPPPPPPEEEPKQPRSRPPFARRLRPGAVPVDTTRLPRRLMYAVGVVLAVGCGAVGTYLIFGPPTKLPPEKHAESALPSEPIKPGPGAPAPTAPPQEAPREQAEAGDGLSGKYVEALGSLGWGELEFKRDGTVTLNGKRVAKHAANGSRISVVDGPFEVILTRTDNGALVVDYDGQKSVLLRETRRQIELEAEIEALRAELRTSSDKRSTLQKMIEANQKLAEERASAAKRAGEQKAITSGQSSGPTFRIELEPPKDGELRSSEGRLIYYLDGTQLYVATSSRPSRIIRMDSSSGDRRWFRRVDFIPDQLLAHNGKLYVLDGREIHIFDAGSGTELRKVRLEEIHLARGRLLAGDDRIFLVTWGLRDQPYSLICVEAASGEPRWRIKGIPTSGHDEKPYMPAITPLFLVHLAEKRATGGDGITVSLAGVDLATGESVWTVPLFSKGFDGSLKATDVAVSADFRHSYVGAVRSLNDIALLSIDNEERRVRWTAPLDNEPRRVLVGANYVASLSKASVELFSSSDGKRLATLPYPGRLESLWPTKEGLAAASVTTQGTLMLSFASANSPAWKSVGESFFPTPTPAGDILSDSRAILWCPRSWEQKVKPGETGVFLRILKFPNPWQGSSWPSLFGDAGGGWFASTPDVRRADADHLGERRLRQLVDLAKEMERGGRHGAAYMACKQAKALRPEDLATSEMMERLRPEARKDIRAFRVLKMFRAETGDVVSAEVTPDARTLVTAHKDGTLRIWEVESGTIRKTIPTGAKKGYGLASALSPDGKTLVCHDLDSIWTLDLSSGRTISKRELNFPNKAAFSPDGKLIAMAWYKGVSLYSPDLSSARHLPETFGAASLAFTRDSGLLAVGSQGEVSFWHPGTGQKISGFRAGGGGYVSALTFSPDGKVLVESSAAWNVGTGKKIGWFSGGKSFAFHPSTSFLASGWLKGRVMVWDVGKLTEVLEGVWRLAEGTDLETDNLEEEIEMLRFSVDGTRMLTRSDQTFRVWGLPE